MDKKEQKRSGELELEKNENGGRNRVTDQRPNIRIEKSRKGMDLNHNVNDGQNF